MKSETKEYIHICPVDKSARFYIFFRLMIRSVVSSGYSGFLHQKKLISSSFHHLDMTLAVAEALGPNKTKPKPGKYRIKNKYRPSSTNCHSELLVHCSQILNLAFMLLF